MWFDEPHTSPTRISTSGHASYERTIVYWLYSLELFARRKLRGKLHAYTLCVQQDKTRDCKQYGASSSRCISARRWSTPDTIHTILLTFCASALSWMVDALRTFCNSSVVNLRVPFGSRVTSTPCILGVLRAQNAFQSYPVTVRQF